jgi:hypothetical protein
MKSEINSLEMRFLLQSSAAPESVHVFEHLSSSSSSATKAAISLQSVTRGHFGRLLFRRHSIESPRSLLESEDVCDAAATDHPTSQ